MDTVLSYADAVKWLRDGFAMSAREARQNLKRCRESGPFGVFDITFGFMPVLYYRSDRKYIRVWS